MAPAPSLHVHGWPDWLVLRNAGLKVSKGIGYRNGKTGEDKPVKEK
jgi:hypothetical protein